MNEGRPGGDVGGSIDPEARTVDGCDPGGTPGVGRLFEAGAALDRFTVLDKLGEGGMGVVVAAYDPTLDRKVAIKVLRSVAGGSESASRGRQRLVREAQAMAKLAHPNVITVHEVGSVDDQVFVVMERVQGQTLGGWLEGEARPWQQVLDVFVQAGRGLAAAHDAKLVHRDFKPDNVLVGDDGRVRVTDFGLVSSSTAEAVRAGGDDGDAPALATTTPMFTTLTHSGALLGTPVYMAPEQHERRNVDARADQFAFCVALYEALYGVRPFGGDDYDELASNVRAGKLAEPARDPGVPDRVRDVVMRGLDRDPAQRFASMHELLDELAPEAQPERRRRGAVWIAIPVVAVVIAAVGVAVVLQRGGGSGEEGVASSQPPPEAPALCAGAANHLAGVWDADVREAMERAFVATEVAFAQGAFERVAAALDRFADRWVVARTEACEATHVRGEQSEALLDLRMMCLDRHLAELAGVTEVLIERVDRALVTNATSIAGSLGGLDACADAETLQAVVPLPDDPQDRARVAELRDRLGRIVALHYAGKYAEAFEGLTALEEESRDLDYKPLRAEISYRLGGVHLIMGRAGEAEEMMRAAMLAATEGRDDRLLAKTLLERVFIVGYMQKQVDEGLAIREHAEAAIARAGDDPVLRAELYNNTAGVYIARGELDQALRLYREAGALLEAELGPNHTKVVATLQNTSSVLVKLGKVDEAVELSRRAVAVSERASGSDHPMTAQAYINLGRQLSASGELEEAIEVLERAVAISQKVYGDDHRIVATPLFLAGATHHELGHYDEACDFLTRSLAVTEAIEGPDTDNATYALVGLGDCNLARGRAGDAVAFYERAVALRDARMPEAWEAAEARFGLARALWAAGRDRGRARRLARRARAGFESAGDGENVARVDGWLRDPQAAP